VATVLLLFDIDGTLLSSNRAGAIALTRAGQAVAGPLFTLEGLNLGGRLDPLIIHEALTVAGASIDLAGAVRARYAIELQALFASGHQADALPGVHALLGACGARSHWTLGLLTGNFPETGQLKLAAAGIDIDQFDLCVWGDDGPTRNHLPAIAMQQVVNSCASHTVVIGDTPADIQCARTCGCQVIAVATGPYVKADLAGGQPDLLLDALTDVGIVLSWLERMTA
jgi:phosphoglycolate phosphatase